MTTVNLPLNSISFIEKQPIFFNIFICFNVLTKLCYQDFIFLKCLNIRIENSNLCNHN